MGQGRGLVMEVRKKSCIVLTSEGLFLEVLRPRGDVEIGQEIVFGRPVQRWFKPHYLAVASLLVAVFAWLAFAALMPRAVAYVAMDINPSVELGIDSSVKIVSARGLNKDGEAVLQGTSILREPLRDGLQQIIDRCIEYKYLDPNKENLVLATVTDVWSENKGVVDTGDVYEYISKPINDSGVDAKLIIARADRETLQKAHHNGITPGRYLLQTEARKKGVLITDEEIQLEKIRELEKKKHFRTEDLIKHWRSNDRHSAEPGNKTPAKDQMPGEPQMLPGAKETPTDEPDHRPGKSDNRGTKPWKLGADKNNGQYSNPSKPDTEPPKKVVNPGVSDKTPGDENNPEMPGKGHKVREKPADEQGESPLGEDRLPGRPDKEPGGKKDVSAKPEKLPRGEDKNIKKTQRQNRENDRKEQWTPVKYIRNKFEAWANKKRSEENREQRLENTANNPR
ncbi:anti-sigma factor domain-containing protein [Desulfoscipio geothermicus]|uniref:Anti-sigma factor N-terminus n=1 Tax=Desulfoscipio geothermicus DSM 3669 TaxID=1121426 RepID=A0A1I6EBI9_9FIRM|nr:anti-sigma factor domain-containing protein [Desulfoscipio geothermicus]SFR15065.1 Anti-sigma factor N-terminus [Desulfoscipio geothermicus DSM 3669]